MSDATAYVPVVLTSDVPVDVGTSLGADPKLAVTLNLDLAGAVEYARAVAPCVLLLGSDATASLRLNGVGDLIAKNVHLLALVEHTDTPNATELLRLGFAGILQIKDVSKFLKAAVHAVFGGEIWASRKTLTSLIRHLQSNDRSSTLTSREREIVKLMADGYNNRQIGEQLFITKDTVRWHVRSIRAKLSPMEMPMRGTKRGTSADK